MLVKFGIIVAYFAVCVIVAWLGSRRKWGYWGYLWSSVLFTPVVGFLLVMASDPIRYNGQDGPLSNRRGDLI